MTEDPLAETNPETPAPGETTVETAPDQPSDAPAEASEDPPTAPSPGVLRHVGARAVNVAGPSGAIYSSVPGQVFAAESDSDYAFLVDYRTDRDPDETVYAPAAAISRE